MKKQTSNPKRCQAPKFFFGAWHLLLVLSLSVFGPALYAQDSAVLSFAGWKAKQVQEASANYLKYMGKNKKSSVEFKNLQQSHELKMIDYLNLYLLPHGNRDALKLASEKMKPDQVLELLEAYVQFQASVNADNSDLSPKKSQ